MYWMLLIFAGFFEAVFAVCLGMANESRGKEAALWLAGFVIALVVSMALLYVAAQKIPIGTAYAVWTGIGAVVTAVAGILIFKEPATFWRLFFIGTLIASIAGLKAVSHV